MEYKLKSRDGNSEILLKHVEKQVVEGQQTYFSFYCRIENYTFSSSLENIWLDEEDIKEICDEITNYIDAGSPLTLSTKLKTRTTVSNLDSLLNRITKA